METDMVVQTKGTKEAALVKAGATRERSYDTMVKALDAESVTVDKFGMEHNFPDHGARLKAAELISKLNGDLKEVVVDNRTYNTNINISPTELKVFTDMVKDVRDQLAQMGAKGLQTGEVVDAETVGEVVSG